MSDTMTVDIRQAISGLAKLAEEVPRKVDGFLAQAVKTDIVDVAASHENCPWQWGTLSDNHGFEKLGPCDYRVYANTPYAAAVHANHPSKAGWFKRVFMANAAKSLRWVAEQVNNGATPGGSSGAKPPQFKFSKAYLKNQRKMAAKRNKKGGGG